MGKLLVVLMILFKKVNGKIVVLDKFDIDEIGLIRGEVVICICVWLLIFCEKSCIISFDLYNKKN